MSLRIYTAYLNNIIKCVEGYKPKLLHELSHLSDIVTTVKELDDLFYMEELLVHAEGEFELISSYLFLYEPLPISTRERLEKSGKPKEIVNAIIENLGELINDDFDVDIDEVFDSDGIFDSPTNIIREFESQRIESYLDATPNDGVFDEVSIYDGSDDEEELEDEEDEYPMDMDDEYPMDIDDFGEDDLEDDDLEDGIVFEDEYSMEDEDEDFEDFEDEYPMEDDEEDLLDEEGYRDTYLDDDYPMDDEEDDDYLMDDEEDDDYLMDDEEDDDYPMDDEEDDDYPMDEEDDDYHLDNDGAEDSWDEFDEDEYDMDLEDEDEYDDEYDMEDEYDDEYGMEDEYDDEYEDVYDDDDEYEDDYDMETEDEDEYDMDFDGEDEYDMEPQDEDEYDMEPEDEDEYDMDFEDEIEDDDFENDVEGFVSTPKKNNIDFTNNFGEKLKPLGKSDSSFHQDLSSSRAIENSFSLGGTPVQPSEKTIDDRIADNIVKLYDYLVQGYRKAKEVIIVDEEE